MIVGLIIVVIGLIFVASVVVPTGELGVFERKRRQQQPNNLEVERELYHGDIVSIQRVSEALLLVIATTLSVAAFGWLIGILIALLTALEYGAIARLTKIRSLSRSLYLRIEPKVLALIQKYPSVVKYFRVFTPESTETVLHSREELQHLIENAGSVLASEEKKLLLSSMQFPARLVSEVMTPRSMIDSVNKVELLGPLVLDDLHKKGHSRFPVIENDVDHVVGVLHLRDLLQVETDKKHTSRVESAMEKRVFYIREDQTLEHALTAFIKTHHHLLIVVNEYRETVGIVTLEDAIEALIGREIVDEFDQHEDLRAVAARHPRANKRSSTAEDV